jgi:hypothetical protein
MATSTCTGNSTTTVRSPTGVLVHSLGYICYVHLVAQVPTVAASKEGEDKGAVAEVA